MSDVFIATTERALTLLGQVLRAVAADPPRAGLDALASDVARAIGAVCEARDHRRDPLSAIEAAQARITLACASAEGTPFTEVLAESLAELLTASRFAPALATPTVTAPRMSVGVLTPRSAPRAAVTPAARALPLPAEQRSHAAERRAADEVSGAARVAAILEKLRPAAPSRAEPPADDEAHEPPDLPSGEADPADAAEPLAAGSPVDALVPDEDEAAFERRWAKDLFEEIAALGMQRTPLADDDPWARAFIEDRLVGAVDAFVGLGDGALAALEALVRDAPAPDPWRLFALGVIAGTVGGRDLAFLFEAALRDLDLEDPDTMTAWASASRLASSPATQAMQRSLLTAEEPLRPFGLVGLASSGAASNEELLDAARAGDPRVVELALVELAARRAAAAGPIASQLLAAGATGEVERAACLVLFALADGSLGAHLARRVRDPAITWAPLLAGASGDPALGVELEGVTRGGATVARVLGVGWAGRTSSLPLLLGLLEAPEEDVADAAAHALARILGEAPIEEREVAPEALADPEVPVPPAAREEGEPQEEPTSRDEGSPDVIGAFSRERALWEPLAERARSRFGASERVRHGEVYEPMRSLEELEAREVPVPPSHAERHLAWTELARHADLDVRFDPDGWVAHQAAALGAARMALGRIDS